MKKFFLAFLLTVTLCCTFCNLCFAYSADTYADLAQSSTQANNLISYASNYDNFEWSDFVVAQIGQYEYRIFWGDLKYNGSSVSGSNVEYIQYVREGSNYDYSYVYRYGTDNTLSLGIDNLVVSNIDECGSRSALYEEFSYYDNMIIFAIFGLAMLIVSSFIALRMCNK